MYKFVIPLPPITKKNSQRILVNHKTGRLFIAPSKQYEQYEKDAAYFIKALGISEPVNIECHFYMPSKRSVDLTNLLEGIDDVLVKCGCIVDDNYKIVVSHDGSRVYVDKGNPRTEVTITEAEKTEYAKMECCNADENVYMCDRCGHTMLLLEGTPNDNCFAFCSFCGARLKEGE